MLDEVLSAFHQKHASKGAWASSYALLRPAGEIVEGADECWRNLAEGVDVFDRIVV